MYWRLNRVATCIFLAVTLRIFLTISDMTEEVANGNVGRRAAWSKNVALLGYLLDEISLVVKRVSRQVIV